MTMLIRHSVIIHRDCPDQFTIVKFRKGDDDKDLKVNGKYLYSRIIIKKINKIYHIYEKINKINRR